MARKDDRSAGKRAVIWEGGAREGEVRATPEAERGPSASAEPATAAAMASDAGRRSRNGDAGRGMDRSLRPDARLLARRARRRWHLVSPLLPSALPRAPPSVLGVASADRVGSGRAGPVEEGGPGSPFSGPARDGKIFPPRAAAPRGGVVHEAAVLWSRPV